MIWYWQILFQLILFAILFGITDFHYHWFKANKKIGPWFHFLWGCAYFAPALFIGIEIYADWKVVVLVTAERFVFYNPMLNLMRGMPFFYLSVDSGSNSSLFDRLELHWNKAFPYVWAVAAAAYIAFQFFV